MAQETVQEKHVKDIKAEQTRDVILASPLCQRTRENPDSASHIRKVDPATLESDLNSLMDKSDEVVLGGVATAYATAISPSGDDIAQYFDVKVLRTWKGLHKVGDTLTLALPLGFLTCGKTSFVTAPGTPWKTNSQGPFVLFLRQSHGNETQWIPAFQLTGGEGLQGMYDLPVSLKSEDYKNCNGVLDGSVGKCNAFLEASQDPISIPNRVDPLLEKYDEMPIAAFLKEVQATADSLGYATQANATK
jgi:hypothetical protein